MPALIRPLCIFIYFLIPPPSPVFTGTGRTGTTGIRLFTTLSTLKDFRMNNEIKFDALIPSEIAAKAELAGQKKAGMPVFSTFILAVLAGAFIAMGGMFMTTVLAGTSNIGIKDPGGAMVYSTALAYGLQRLLGGLAFCLGLILVVIGGAELFTGNNLIVMAWASGKVSTFKMLRNWIIVYIGNMLGSIATATLMFFTLQYTFPGGSGSIGLTALNVAVSKTQLAFFQALALGILCNALVCMAVWLTYSGRSVADKIFAIIFPITAFVAAGFEHSVANMYLIPMGLLIKTDQTFLAKIGKTAADYDSLTWYDFFITNLVPVTIGNIIGGAVLVGVIYWVAYLRPEKK